MSCTAPARPFAAPLACAALLLLAAGCGGGVAPPAEAEAAGVVTVADVGFSTPESVLHDPLADVYLVSNIAGDPLGVDGNGFISRVGPAGDVRDLRWIDGQTEGVTLNAPKGMALQGDRLYVADIDCIRIFDRETGAPLGEACPSGATFLNDVAPAPDGTSIFFTDSGLDASFASSGTDTVYRLSEDGRIIVVARDPALGSPNGIAVGPRGIFVASFLSGEVYRLDAEGNRTDVMPASDRQYDGLAILDDGGFLVSSWGDSCVYRVGADGTVACAVEGVEAPADIGFDHERGRVLIPLFNANEVRIVPIG